MILMYRESTKADCCQERDHNESNSVYNRQNNSAAQYFSAARMQLFILQLVVHKVQCELLIDR